jgi:pimeloyl-ACP methyl ester carboxylesterase
MRILLSLLSIVLATFLSSCTATTDVKKSNEINQVKTGSLSTAQGYSCTYQYYPAEQNGPTVIYLAGSGGRVAYKGGGIGGYALAAPLNEAGFNFIGFDRPDAKYGRSLKETIYDLYKRAESGDDTCPSIDGKECAAENIVRNEVSTIIEFIEKTPTHSPEKGIYLIGDSFGSVIALYTVKSFPEKIKSVVFLSPAISPKWVSPEFQAEFPQFNIEKCFEDLFKAYGQRPGLAIGSKKDIFDVRKTTSTLEGAEFIKTGIGSNIKILAVSTGTHGSKLIANDKYVRGEIVKYLNEVSNSYQ